MRPVLYKNDVTSTFFTHGTNFAYGTQCLKPGSSRRVVISMNIVIFRVIFIKLLMSLRVGISIFQLIGLSGSQTLITLFQSHRIWFLATSFLHGCLIHFAVSKKYFSRGLFVNEYTLVEISFNQVIILHHHKFRVLRISFNRVECIKLYFD